MWHFTSYILKYQSNLLVKRIFFFLLNAAFAMAILIYFHMYILHYMTSCYPNS